MLRRMVLVAVCVAGPVPVAAAVRVVRVDGDGRAVGAIPPIGSRDHIAIELVGGPASQTWAIQYRFHKEPDDYLADATPQACPSPTSAAKIGVVYSCPLAAATPARHATLDPPKGTHFVSYSLLIEDKPNNRWNARKLGWLVMGRRRKLVSYALRARPDAAQPFHLERLGDYPVITDVDRLYAVIVDAKKDQFHFDLSFNAAKGEIANPAPIRPSFSPADVSSTAAPPPPEHETKTVFTDDAHADVLLAFGETFRGGDIVKVTISTEMEVTTKDSSTVSHKQDGSTKTSGECVKEKQVVKLLDGVQYPQVHPLYAYNISTGLVTSWLRQPTYIKVQTVAGAEAAANRYRTETIEGGMSVKPVAALSFYLRRVDIQEPLTWKERAVPAPTLGFSLKNPTEDVFLGFSHELVRNTQIFYGWHFGKIDVQGPVGELEDHFATVTTVKKFKSDFFLGITLNIGGIKDLISK